MSPIRFGTDGWRAIIADEFTFANVRRVARGIAATLLAQTPAPRVVVGYDTRFASAASARVAAEALAASGVAVTLSEQVVPTPAVSWAVVQRQADVGVMITASHNPPQFNGLKVKNRFGSAIGAEEVATLETAIDAVDMDQQRGPASAGRAQIDEVNLQPAYLARLAELVELPALRAVAGSVIVDSMYGAGAGYLTTLLDGGAARVSELHGQPHPLFPGLRGPEPIAANLVDLGRAVAASGALLGLALDGDGDRVGFVDEQGHYVNQQQVFALLTLYLIEERGQRGPIVKSVNATAMLDQIAAAHRLPVTTTPVGFKFLGPRLRELNGLIAGEESGGFAFQGHVPERDGILAGLYLLDYLRRRRCAPSALIADLHRRFGASAYDRLDIVLDPDPAQRERLAAHTRAVQPTRLAGWAVTSISLQDGTKISLSDGRWLLIRLSGTEPLLRLYAEGRSTAEVDRLLAAGRQLLNLA